jgi:putrescine aminotransferase
MSDLISLAECERLPVARVHEEYRRHVGRAQVSLMTSFAFGRELVDHAEGTTIHTTDGRRVLDFTGGVGVLNHGHNHPAILAARERHRERGRMESHQQYFSPYVAALSHNLARLLPGDLAVSFFPNSGAEAVEGAVQVAYRYHGGRRHRILHADISFHGKLLGSGSLTGASRHTFTFPGIGGVHTYAYDDIESVRAAVAAARDMSGVSDVYAILVEPFSASTMRHCSERFLRELRQLCTDEDIVLVFDEIYTGWGKTGSLFYFMRYPDLVPDLLTTSKSFGGGKSSISAFVVREPVFRRACGSLTDALAHSSTTACHGFGEEIATALAAVRIAVDDDYPGRARGIERQLGDGLRRLAYRHPGVVAEVSGVGALWGVFLDGGPKVIDLVARLAPGGLGRDPNVRTKLVTAAVVDALYRDHDVYTYYTLNGRNPLVAAPSLVASADDVERFLRALDDTLSRGLTRLLVRFVRQQVGSLW